MPLRPALVRLPFWLLIAAWLCANTPEIATWHFASWVKEARHFGHQERLRDELSALLAGNASPASTPHSSLAVGPAREAPPAAPPAAASPDGAVKKILLALGEREPLAVPLSDDASLWQEAAARRAAARTDEVPHPPPRTAA